MEMHLLTDSNTAGAENLVATLGCGGLHVGSPSTIDVVSVSGEGRRTKQLETDFVFPHRITPSRQRHAAASGTGISFFGVSAD